MKPASLALTALPVLALAAPAAADRRSFTHTYEYMTMPEAETELEIYTEQARTTLDGPSDKTFTFQIEIEHGITRRWDVSLYHVFKQVAGATPATDQAFGLDEMKLRSRYRFAERGQWPVNVVAYGELIRVFAEPVWEAEAKAIITRDFGKLTLAVNLIGEVKFGPAVDEPEVEAGWAVGLGYEIQPEIKVGVETWGGFEVEDPDVVEAYVGPAVSWAPSSSLWVTTTVGFAVTEFADDLNIRGIIGMHLQ